MKALVLTYHSHNIWGVNYASNDHVALACDLRVVHAAGAHIVPLGEIAQRLGQGFDGGDEEVLVGLSFDDGPMFDFADFTHPQFGQQRGFLNILRDFRAEIGDGAQPGLNATSFVIASPDARKAMERSEECGYTFLADWLDERWWKNAIESGLIDIGNHSWDHVHQAAPSVATSSDVRNDFTVVNTYTDADREIRAAAAYINARVDGGCRLFAFPFGHTNEYLVEDYLPLRAYEHGMVAAFGTGGRPVVASDSIWNIPRAVCGHDWKSAADLESLLRL